MQPANLAAGVHQVDNLSKATGHGVQMQKERLKAALVTLLNMDIILHDPLRMSNRFVSDTMPWKAYPHREQRGNESVWHNPVNPA